MIVSELTIAGRLNGLPLTKHHKIAAFIIGFALFFEFFDVNLGGVLGAVLTKQFSVSSSLQPLLLGSAFLGMFFGALIINTLSDRIGRKKAFFINLLVYSVFTFLGAFSPNVGLLIVFRFLAGIGIGSQPALCDTYLSEILPQKNRGRIMAWAYTLQFCAVPIEGFLAQWIVPTHAGMAGWRWLFILGALGALVAWALQKGLPESPRWLEAVGRREEAEKIFRHFAGPAVQGSAQEQSDNLLVIREKLPVSTLFQKEFVGRTAMLWVFQILQTLGYYGFGTLVPLVLSAKGFTLVHSLEYTAISFIGYPVGSLLSLPIIERVQRKWLIVSAAFGMALFGILFGMSHSSATIMIFGFLYTLVSNIFSNSYHVFQAEIFPTSIRGTATGIAYSLSRLMSGLMPFILLPVLKNDGATAMFSIVAIAMFIIMIDIGAFGPKTTGIALESLNEGKLANHDKSDHFATM
jgi:putative MFS transporter